MSPIRRRVAPVLVALLAALLAGACPGPTASREPAGPPVASGPSAAPVDAAPAPRAPVRLSIVGTNDLHGHIEALPLLAGYLANLRRARAGDGGVVLVDAGDMFQGTLESNLGEGAAVVRAYGALGYAAVAIGNHEFDFGPAGEAATPRGPGDDPRGALKARAAEASFPFLAANVIDRATGKAVAWPNVRPTALVEVAGVRVGLIGVTTTGTPKTTIAANFAGLEVAPLAATIAREAAALRAAGATVVVVAAHAGGRCRKLDDPDDLSSCEAGAEIFDVARALPAGAVDAIVAGHSHAGIAHRVAGIPVIESFAGGRAFGRVDLVVDPTTGRVREAQIFPPTDLCAEGKPGAGCRPGSYEGAPVAPDGAIARLLEEDVARAAARRAEKVGVRLEGKITRAYGVESRLGNLLADLMREARPGADVAVTNGGGLRADLPAGELTYGHLFEAFPFDNRFATVRATAGDLRRLVEDNLAGTGGILSLSGLTAEARCEDGKAVVTLLRGRRKLRDGDRLTILTSDFLATGGDGAFGRLPEGAVTIEDGPPIREEVFALLRKRGGTIRADDRAILDPARPRLRYPGRRPVRCGPSPQP